MSETTNPTPHFSGGILADGGMAHATRAAHQQPEKKSGSAAPMKRAAWKGSQTLVDSGQHIAAAVINRKDLSYMSQYVDDIYSTDDRVRDDALSVLVGISASFAAVFESARDSGQVKFTGDRLPTPVDVHYALRTDMGRFERYVKSQIDLLEKLFASGTGLSVSFPGAGEATKAETPAPLEPIAVRVVEMPARHTVTNVEYDMADRIVGSDQIEKDIRP
jgi:hypothetical protein